MAAAGDRVQCVITSPPYFQLRAYGSNAAGVWGGDPLCGHEWHATTQTRDMRKGAGLAALGARFRGGGHKLAANVRHVVGQATCQQCPAWYGELGHEPLHDCAGWATGMNCGQCYICHMREVMRGVRSILAEDGLAWVIIGDGYATSGGEGRQGAAGCRAGRRHTQRGLKQRVAVPAKNLLLVPQRFSLAMQADGWIVRQEIIWWKDNCVPESVRDRCTKAHEQVWLLAKSQRYYWDHDAMKEAAVSEVAVGHLCNQSSDRGLRNRRTVWRVPTVPYNGAHLAVFPPSLVRSMIASSTRPGDVVFDPFMGSGTLAAEAQRLGRRFGGAEINPANEPLQQERLRDQIGMPI